MKYGWKKSSGDLGITPFARSSTIVKLGASASQEHIIPEYTPISNQGQIGTCGANAICDCFEILYGLQYPLNVTQLSRLFLYWNARVYTQTTGEDSGIYIHNGMDSLIKTGCCRESTWPYIISNVYAQPNQIAYKEGDDNKLNTFYQIISFDEDRLNDIESAIKANHPVIFGTIIGQELENYNGDPDKVFEFPNDSLGGHAMMITGIRTNSSGKREFLIRNSWSKNWGNKNYPGHAWFSSDYIKNDDTGDLFVGTLMSDLCV